MSDIFISYAKNDISVVRDLVKIFEKRGWSVWWERDISTGEEFDKLTSDALNDARCIIVLWSNRSVKSRWVLADATQGLSQKKLIPVLLEDVHPPKIFGDIQSINFIVWDGREDTASIKRLLTYIGRILISPSVTHREENPPIMDKEKIKVFISYSRADLPKAEKLVKQLDIENDIEVWFDAVQILPGDNFVDKMMAAIETCDKFLICLSPSFEKKSPQSWVRREFRAAMLDENRQGRNIIIPVRIKRGGKVPNEIGPIAYADLSTTQRWQKNYPRLLAAIRK